jgi:hypothetical protein
VGCRAVDKLYTVGGLTELDGQRIDQVPGPQTKLHHETAKQRSEKRVSGSPTKERDARWPEAAIG